MQAGVGRGLEAAGEALVAAARGDEEPGAGDLEAVRSLLDQGVSADYRDDDSWTALEHAAEIGNVAIVRLLLERGATADLRDIHGFTPHSFSARCGRLEVTQILVGHGADVNNRDEDGDTPTIEAASYDHLAVCEFLLSKGSNLLEVNDNGQTALTQYGRHVHPPLSPETLALRRDALTAAWRAGPHPSQVQRRRDEAWDRRKSLMQVTAENGYRPLSHVVAAMPPVDPAAAIPAIPLDNAEQRHAHLLGQVLSNEGIHRNIVSML